MVSIDNALFHMINGWSGNPVLDGLFLFLTTIGEGGAIWLLLAAVLILGAGRLPGLRGSGHARWRSVGLALILAEAFSGLLEAGLKDLIQRPRPPLTLTGVHVIGTLPASYSFPSGHTLSSFAAAAVLLAASRLNGVGNRYDGWFAVVLAALIGFSRIWVGHHYPLDVFVGALLGLPLGWYTWKAVTGVLTRRTTKRSPSLH